MVPHGMTEAQWTLVKGVKAHADRNYNRGWDQLIECWADHEILREIGGARTVRGAIAKIAPTIAILHEQARAIRAEAF